MSNVFFSSDLHFGHKNIIKFSNRPYTEVEEMNEDIVAKHNALVGPEDTWYCLGDVSFAGDDVTGPLLKRMNGKFKYLIKGNHDGHKGRLGILEHHFDAVYQYMELNGFMQHPIILMHYPIHEWNRYWRQAMHLHGHTHGMIDNKGLLRWDMGIDCWNMRPVALEEMIKLWELKKDEVSEIWAQKYGRK